MGEIVSLLFFYKYPQFLLYPPPNSFPVVEQTIPKNVQTELLIHQLVCLYIQPFIIFYNINAFVNFIWIIAVDAILRVTLFLKLQAG